MKPKEFEVLRAAAAEERLPSWFESAELTEITSDLVARGLIEKVDLHKPFTGAEPRHYRATPRGLALWERTKTWDAAKSVALPDD